MFGNFRKIFDQSSSPAKIAVWNGMACGITENGVLVFPKQSLTPAQQLEAHIRGVEPMLERIAAHDARPLSVPRPAHERLVGVCRHFTLLHVAMLRRRGVPARARCGFGAYFEKGRFVDHWVTEFWNEAERRWQLVDAQIDARQRALFRISFDPAIVASVSVPRRRPERLRGLRERY